MKAPFWAVLCLGGSLACAAAELPAAVDLQWAVKIPVRDGVKLNATVFKPHQMDGPLPVIFTFTPYIGDSYEDRAMYFARNGYVYALVDVRGRGNSEGAFEPFANEGHDGYEVPSMQRSVMRRIRTTSAPLGNWSSRNRRSRSTLAYLCGGCISIFLREILARE